MCGSRLRPPPPSWCRPQRAGRTGTARTTTATPRGRARRPKAEPRRRCLRAPSLRRRSSSVHYLSGRPRRRARRPIAALLCLRFHYHRPAWRAAKLANLVMRDLKSLYCRVFATQDPGASNWQLSAKNPSAKHKGLDAVDETTTTSNTKPPNYSSRSTPPSPPPTRTTGSSGRIDAGKSPCSTAPGHASSCDAINHTSPRGSRKNKSTT